MIAGCFVSIPDDFDMHEYPPATDENIRAFMKEIQKMAQAPGKQNPVPPPSQGSGPLPKR